MGGEFEVVLCINEIENCAKLWFCSVTSFAG